MFWGLIMEPNKRYTQEVEKSFHVSQAALDISSSDGEPVQVMLTFDKRNYLIGTLQKDKNVQIPLDLNFETGNMISFTSNGNSHVHLTGYLVPDDPYDNIVDDENEEMESDEEEEEEQAPKLVPIKKEKRKAVPIAEVEPVPKKNKKTKVPALADLLNETKDDETSSDDDEFDPNNVTAQTNDSEDEILEFDSDGLVEELADNSDEEDSSDDENEEQDEDDNSSEEDEQQEEEIVEEKPLSKNQLKKLKKNSTDKSPITNGVDSKKKVEANKKDAKKEKANESTKKNLPGGLSVEDLKVGQGKTAQSGNKVQVYYVGRLKSNNKIFDSTLKGPGFKFSLGKGEVIRGWDLGVSGMKVGGKRRMIIPPQMAYGAKGSPPVIPPNSTLIFEVELLKIH